MKALTTILAALLLLAAVTPGVAAADDGFLDGFDDDDEAGVLATVQSLAAGLADRAQLALAAIGDEETTAEEDAQAAQEAFNEHNGSFVAYANNRTTASTDWDVFAIEFERNDETATVYLVATVNETTGNYTSAEVVDETGRSVDKTLYLRDFASKHAAEEIDTFRETFVEPEKAVTKTYLTRMASKYPGDDVDAPFLSLGGGS